LSEDKYMHTDGLALFYSSITSFLLLTLTTWQPPPTLTELYVCTNCRHQGWRVKGHAYYPCPSSRRQLCICRQLCLDDFFYVHSKHKPQSTPISARKINPLKKWTHGKDGWRDK
jgi:hypothetical protein